MARLTSQLGRAALAALGVAAFVIGGLMLVARPAPSHPFFSAFDQYPLIMAHADDTGSGLWPGNTMPFLEGVAGLGVDILEMDVTMTEDGVVVLMHDTTVDRTTDGAGRVSDLALAELRQLEVGVNWTQDGGQSHPYRGQGLRVPTLEEVFARFPGYPMNIEIKQETPSMAAALCELIRRSGRQDSVLVASFSDTAMGEFRAACPEVATAASQGEVRAFVLLNFAFLADTVTPAYAAHQVPMRSGGIPVVTRSFVDAAGRRDLQVHVWTVNDPDQMRQLIAMGVDGIMTDRPDLLAELLGR